MERQKKEKSTEREIVRRKVPRSKDDRKEVVASSVAGRDVVSGEPVRVSVIIPHFSALKSAKECLTALQKHGDDICEILIAGMEPVSALKSFVAKSAKADGHLVLLPQQSTEGRIARLNNAMHNAQGDFIAIVDESIIVTSEWISHLHTCMHRDKVTTIVGPLFSAGTGMQSIQFTGKMSGLDKEAALFYQRNRDRRVPAIMVSGLCLMLKKDLIERINGFDPSFEEEGGEVEDFCLRAELEGFRIMIAGDVLVGAIGNPTIQAAGKAFSKKWNSVDPASSMGQRLRSWRIRNNAEHHEFAGRVDGAITVLKGGIAVFPQSKRLYTLLVWTYIRAKRFDEAMEFIKSTPDAIKKNREWLELTAFCLIGLKQISPAMECVERALAIRSTSARAILLKGILAEYDGNVQKAVECFQQSSKENPADGSATSHLGSLRWTQGDRAAALSLVERAFVLSPTDEDILATFKEIAGQMGKQELLLQRLQEGLVFYPQHRGMLYAYAEICSALGKYDDAYRTLKQGLLEFGPEATVLQSGSELRQRLVPPGKKSQKPILSVCMIMKNEEKNLVRSLASIDPIADEIVVMDTGSTDNSKAVCVFFGASVHDAEWQEDFSAARNESIAHAAGSWILVLDADEVIAQADHAALRELVEKKSRKKVAYSLKLRDYVAAGTLDGWNPNGGEYREEMGDGWLPGTTIRLFPNEKQICFQNKVHETVDASLAEAGIEIKACDVVVHHYGRLDAARTPEKAERALAIARMKLQESGQSDTHLLTELALQEQGLQHFTEALELWERLVKTAPKDIKGYLGVGQCSIKLQKYQAAITALRKALEFDPASHEGAVLLAQAYLHLARTSDAVVLLEEYCESNRNDGFAHVVLAAAYICHDREAKAQRVIRGLREQQIAYIEFMNELAQILRAEGKEMHADALEIAAMPPQARRW